MTRDLVERARKGDHDAFAELAGAAISRLDATAWLMLRDADRATDAVQNALVRAWRDLPTLRDPDRFDAWLHRLLVNACIDEIRRDRRRHLDVDITDLSNPPSIADAASAIADRDQLERALQPARARGAGGHRLASLPRPAVAGGRGDARDPVGHDQVPPVPRAQGDARGARRRRSPGPRHPRGAPGMNRERRLRPPRLRLAPRGCRAPGAGAPRCRPAADPDGATAPGMVEPRKVAPRGHDTSLRRRPPGSPGLLVVLGLIIARSGAVAVGVGPPAPPAAVRPGTQRRHRVQPRRRHLRRSIP